MRFCRPKPLPIIYQLGRSWSMWVSCFWSHSGEAWQPGADVPLYETLCGSQAGLRRFVVSYLVRQPSQGAGHRGCDDCRGTSSGGCEWEAPWSCNRLKSRKLGGSWRPCSCLLSWKVELQRLLSCHEVLCLDNMRPGKCKGRRYAGNHLLQRSNLGHRSCEGLSLIPTSGLHWRMVRSGALAGKLFPMNGMLLVFFGEDR